MTVPPGLSTRNDFSSEHGEHVDESAAAVVVQDRCEGARHPHRRRKARTSRTPAPASPGPSDYCSRVRQVGDLVDGVELAVENASLQDGSEQLEEPEDEPDEEFDEEPAG